MSNENINDSDDEINHNNSQQDSKEDAQESFNSEQESKNNQKEQLKRRKNDESNNDSNETKNKQIPQKVDRGRKRKRSVEKLKKEKESSKDNNLSQQKQKSNISKLLNQTNNQLEEKDEKQEEVKKKRKVSLRRNESKKNNKEDTIREENESQQVHEISVESSCSNFIQNNLATQKENKDDMAFKGEDKSEAKQKVIIRSNKLSQQEPELKSFFAKIDDVTAVIEEDDDDEEEVGGAAVQSLTQQNLIKVTSSCVLQSNDNMSLSLRKILSSPAAVTPLIKCQEDQDQKKEKDHLEGKIKKKPGPKSKINSQIQTTQKKRGRKPNKEKQMILEEAQKKQDETNKQMMLAEAQKKQEEQKQTMQIEEQPQSEERKEKAEPDKIKRKYVRIVNQKSPLDISKQFSQLFDCIKKFQQQLQKKQEIARVKSTILSKDDNEEEASDEITINNCFDLLKNIIDKIKQKKPSIKNILDIISNDNGKHFESARLTLALICPQPTSEDQDNILKISEKLSTFLQELLLKSYFDEEEKLKEFKIAKQSKQAQGSQQRLMCKSKQIDTDIQLIENQQIIEEKPLQLKGEEKEQGSIQEQGDKIEIKKVDEEIDEDEEEEVEIIIHKNQNLNKNQPNKHMSNIHFNQMCQSPSQMTKEYNTQSNQASQNDIKVLHNFQMQQSLNNNQLDNSDYLDYKDNSNTTNTKDSSQISRDKKPASVDKYIHNLHHQDYSNSTTINYICENIKHEELQSLLLCESKSYPYQRDPTQERICSFESSSKADMTQSKEGDLKSMTEDQKEMRKKIHLKITKKLLKYLKDQTSSKGYAVRIENMIRLKDPAMGTEYKSACKNLITRISQSTFYTSQKKIEEYIETESPHSLHLLDEEKGMEVREESQWTCTPSEKGDFKQEFFEDPNEISRCLSHSKEELLKISEQKDNSQEKYNNDIFNDINITNNYKFQSNQKNLSASPNCALDNKHSDPHNTEEEEESQQDVILRDSSTRNETKTEEMN